MHSLKAQQILYAICIKCFTSLFCHIHFIFTQYTGWFLLIQGNIHQQRVHSLWSRVSTDRPLYAHSLDENLHRDCTILDRRFENIWNIQQMVEAFSLAFHSIIGTLLVGFRFIVRQFEVDWMLVTSLLCLLGTSEPHQLGLDSIAPSYVFLH